MNIVTPTSGERSRTTWTPSMDRYFIDLVIDQVRRGNMVDHAFRKQIWTHMTALFNEKFGFQYDKDVLKNRYKSLRRKYNETKTLLDQSGFHWDETRQMVIADDHDWDDYIKAHPDARSYRTKILPYYDDLCMIYGSARADGKYSRSGHNEDLDDESSRTKSGDTSGSLHSPHTPIAHGDPVDDAHESSYSSQDTAQGSTDKGTTNALCEIAAAVPSLELAKKDCDNLIPVEVIFALEAVPSILHTTSGNRSRVTWTPSMDRYFIGLMLDHVHKGNKIGRSFNKEAWMQMTALFNEKFGSQYDKDVLTNRFKTLRKQYISIKSLLDHSGFCWDETLQMVSADVHVWDDYIKAHPDARQYRVRPVPHFNDLCVIYGDTTVDGRDSCSDHIVNLKDDNQGKKIGGASRGLQSSFTAIAHKDSINDLHEELSHLDGDMDISNHLNKRLFATPSTAEHSKKPRMSTNESMVNALREMATAVTSLVDKKKENSDTFSIEHVIDALQAVPDIDEDLLLDACDFLEDERNAKTFMALDIRLRKKWLMRKLRPLLS